MKIQKQGKSLKVVLPQDVAAAYELKAGDSVEWMSDEWHRLTLKKIVPRDRLVTNYNPLEKRAPVRPVVASDKA